MPRYHFQCPKCFAEVKVIRPPEKQKDLQICKCGYVMRRNPQGASSKIIETLDNGAMSRRVERPADVERLNAERSKVPQDREP